MKGRDVPCSWKGRLGIVQRSVHPDWSTDSIPVQAPASSLMDIYKLIARLRGQAKIQTSPRGIIGKYGWRTNTS